MYNGGLWGGQLEKWQTGSFVAGDPGMIPGDDGPKGAEAALGPYAAGTDPMGPFTYRGRILEPVLGWTTHHSIIEYHGKWYLFYHDCELSNGINHRRNVKYVELEYNEDGTIKTICP